MITVELTQQEANRVLFELDLAKNAEQKLIDMGVPARLTQHITAKKEIENIQEKILKEIVKQ